MLQLGFTTLSDYLWMLRIICNQLGPLGKRVMLYLAAAVSDFYIPAQEMPEHKMQSSEGAPSVRLKIVPKMLAPLVKHWVPEAFVVSFKLETDENLLISKSKRALATYNHRIVVANLLNPRKERVVLVDKDGGETVITMSKEELFNGSEIEEKIIAHLASLHSQF